MSTPKTPPDHTDHPLITTRKRDLYEEWKARNGIKGTMEQANAFYSGYSEGYVVSCEEMYAERKELVAFVLEMAEIEEHDRPDEISYSELLGDAVKRYKSLIEKLKQESANKEQL